MDKKEILKDIAESDLSDDGARERGYQNKEHYIEVRAKLLDVIDAQMRGTGLVYMSQIMDMLSFFSAMAKVFTKRTGDDPILVRPILNAIGVGLGGEFNLTYIGKAEDIASDMGGGEPATKKDVVH